jgi:hypothetical protein
MGALKRRNGCPAMKLKSHRLGLAAVQIDQRALQVFDPAGRHHGDEMANLLRMASAELLHRRE